MGGLPARGARWFSIGQPMLTLLLTLVVAVFVTTPSGQSLSSVTAAAPDLSVPLSGLPAAEAVGRSLLLPGQGTPNGLTPIVGPGTPAGDGRAVRLSLQGHERGYLLLPALGLPPGQRAALVVVLHQDVGSAAAVAQGLGLDRLRREGVTLAYPAGVAGAWNAGDCCGAPMTQRLDDVGFVNAVLDDVGRRVPIDPRRRALVGYSGGGMLAYRLLCSPHPALVAVVEVSGSLEAPCAGAVTLPDLLAIHGAKDGTVGLTTPIRVSHLGMSPRPVTSTMGVVTKQARCGRRSTRDLDGVRYVHWKGCRGNSTIDLQIVVDAGHGWDSVGGTNRTIPFLESHLLRAA
jgi:polyhydroxybutyrate depolymerase